MKKKLKRIIITVIAVMCFALISFLMIREAEIQRVREEQISAFLKEYHDMEEIK